MTKYIFDHLASIQQKISRTKHLYLFLDYDGTLIYFKNKPEDVSTPNPVINILTQLINQPNITVCTISGRPLQDLKRLLPINGLHYAGLHGMQIEYADGKTYSWGKAEQSIPLVTQIQKKAKSHFQHEQELLIENKDLSIAFHYRLLPEERKQQIIHAIIQFVQNIDVKDQLQMIPGQQVIEYRPKGWHKGKAVSYLLKHHQSFNQILPIYIGDDTTDEDAFKQITGKGISILVKNQTEKETYADYWLHDPDDVLKFLTFIIRRIQTNLARK